MVEESRRDYGWQGRLGLGTPQANPTVEAEMRRLIPIGVDFFTVRLTSASDQPKTRLIEYATDLPAFMDRFAGLKLDGFLFACTASSYLIDEGQLEGLIDKTEQKISAPVILAAKALEEQLEEWCAQKIAFVTPYPKWLNDHALAYWQKKGFEIVTAGLVDIGSEDTYGIYKQPASSAQKVLDQLGDVEADAFVISGTGMPSLPVIKGLSQQGRHVVSSNLALATRGLKLLGEKPTPPNMWAFGG